MLALQKREAAESEQRVKQLEEQRHTEHLANDELRARLKHYDMQIAEVGSQVQLYSEKHDSALLFISRLRDNQNAGACLYVHEACPCLFAQVAYQPYTLGLGCMLQSPSVKRSWHLHLKSASCCARRGSMLCNASPACQACHTDVLCVR